MGAFRRAVSRHRRLGPQRPEIYPKLVGQKSVTSSNLLVEAADVMAFTGVVRVCFGSLPSSSIACRTIVTTHSFAFIA